MYWDKQNMFQGPRRKKRTETRETCPWEMSLPLEKVRRAKLMWQKVSMKIEHTETHKTQVFFLAHPFWKKAVIMGRFKHRDGQNWDKRILAKQNCDKQNWDKQNWGKQNPS